MNRQGNLPVLFLMLFAVSAPGAHAQETIFRLPRDRDTYFRNYGGTGSEYFQFRGDGTYRKINREHMFVQESDHGTWTQADSGEVTLVSPEHYRNIECPPLSIYMWYPHLLEKLEPTKAKIADLLDKTTSETLASEVIEGIEKYGYNNVLSRVQVDFRVKQVTRAQLKALVAKIDEFQKDPEKNHFHLTPMTLGSVTFLLWKDSQTPLNRSVEDIKRVIGEATGGRPPSLIFVSIDKDTFDKESATTQEFIYHKEMNRRGKEGS